MDDGIDPAGLSTVPVVLLGSVDASFSLQGLLAAWLAIDHVLPATALSLENPFLFSGLHMACVRRAVSHNVGAGGPVPCVTITAPKSMEKSIGMLAREVVNDWQVNRAQKGPRQ